ncbi:uncharacterized protein JCM6883_004263 [Sporobolomyces salmoneus]|uniref:uncharacterized protein n=1 Tax=Sporobolomyces salmoneus TaxID=183962 RepID=UPI00316EB4F9
MEAGPEANTTLALTCILVVVLVFAFKLRPPPPQIHPFLLGRQSRASLTRFEDESPVYTNPSEPSTGYLRPDKAVKTLEDVLEGSLTCLEGGKRGSWVKGGEKITELVKAIRAGLLSKLGNGPGKVVVAVEDPTDALLVTLALATSSHKPVVIAPGSQIPDEKDITGIVHSATKFISARGVSANPDAVLIVLGEEDDNETADDVLATGKAVLSGETTQESSKAEPSHLALTLISEGISLDFSHVSLTAALVSWLSLFPHSPLPTKPTIKDTIYTFHHPSTPYGLGLALLAISTSASLYYPELSNEPTSEEIESIFAARTAPPATLIFAPSSTLATPLYTTTLQKMIGDSSFIIRQARNGKLRLLREGSVSKSTIWDKILFKGLRKDLGLHMLRGVFFSGPLEQGKLETFRCTFGTPAVSTLSHPFLLAPLSFGHMYDYQRLPPPGLGRLTGKEKAHVGSPAVGIELKLRGSEEDISKSRIKGEIFVRSPVLPRPETLPTSLLHFDEILPTLPPAPGAKAEEAKIVSQWLRTGLKAEISTEGVLWLSADQ